MLVNGIRATQFFVTPRFEELYRRIHSDKPQDMVDEGLKAVALMQGGSVSLSALNDQMLETDKSWLLEDLNGPSRRDVVDLALEINAGECCPPSAVRAIHNAWRHTVVHTSDGTFVNLGLYRDNEYAEVFPAASYEAGLTVRVKQPDDFLVRVPSWADRTKVSAISNGKRIEPVWHGDYLLFSKAKANDELVVEYPQVERVQEIRIGDPPRVEECTIHWSGNWVKSVAPRGKYLPMYAAAPEPLPPFPSA